MKTHSRCAVVGYRQKGRKKRVEFRRSAGVVVPLIQMVENFANGFGLSDESDDAQRPTALTFQSVDLVDAFDEAGPRFS